MSWVGPVVLIALLLAGPASGQESLAKVADVRPQASAGLGKNQVTLVQGSDLREGETVITGRAGEVQVIFADDTHLVIGAGSSLVIERYLMRNDGTPERFAVNALAGTFRFITGKGDKQAYSIGTPTGTIGVRGTEFDFTVARGSGRTSVILFEGGVDLCSRAGDCVALNERCDVGQLTSRRDAELVADESRRLDVASSDFPFVKSQSRLMREFRVRLPQDCARERVVRTADRDIAPPPVAPDPAPPPPPPLPPPPPDPEPEPEPTKGNNGWGNGGENGEGPDEKSNPGNGHKDRPALKRNGNGKP